VPEALSSDDSSVLPRCVGIGRERLVRVEVFVALDRESELAAHGAQFGERHVAELLGPSMALALRARLRRFKTGVPF
jgi:hypothetical protein